MKKISIIFTIILVTVLGNAFNVTQFEDTMVVKLERCRGIIFKAKYTRDKIFTNAGNSISSFFTPEKKTAKYIDENLESNFSLLTNNSQRQDNKFKVRKDSLKKYDKQFVGYVDSKKDSIILVRIINFESDPYKLRKHVEKDFLINTNEWSESNTLIFKFFKQQNKFISAYE